jgi:predicted dehydrogenase
MEAIKAGKPYCLEKPVTMTAGQAETLYKETKDLKHMVCFSYRFKDAARYARDLVQSGQLGQIYHVNAEYAQAWGKHAKLVWRFIKEVAGTGALGDLGCHMIDLVRFVTGREFTRVVADAENYVSERELPDGSGTGRADVDDYCNYLARMEGGISTTFHITRFAPGRGNYQRMVIYGEKGSLVYTLDEKPGANELKLFLDKNVKESNPFSSRKFVSKKIPEKFKSDQMQSFADIINGKSDGLPANILDGYKVQLMLDAVEESFIESKWVNIK